MAGPTGTVERHTAEPEPPGEGGGTSFPPSARWRFRRPGRRSALAAGVLTVVLGAFGVWALYGSAWLRVEEVSVSGTRVLTAGQVRDVADVPLGVPLASLDTQAAERRVRDRLRRVEHVRVTRAWPHGIDVRVTERRPVLVVHTGDGRSGSGGRYAEVDAEGVRFATVRKPPRGVPRLRVEGAGDTPSAEAFGPRALRRAGARVVTALPALVRKDVRSVRIRSYDRVAIELTGKRTVEWGAPEGGALKAEALAAVMKASPGAGRFDVTAPRAPAASGA
ncbi:cell division protein FtsQ/DivIB [Streptomyces sp. TR02-1]|uniref:cell division protein FtsQ/DivIB n=1 Tax=Streptomyces sp. TR02-1 TaxID=3385977 RepID=UPI0039A15714